MDVDTETKALLKFGSLETLCVDRGSKKLLEFSHYRYMSMQRTGDYAHSITHLGFPYTMSVVYEILNCGCRH